MPSNATESELTRLISLARDGVADARSALLEQYRSYLGLLARIQVDCRLTGRVSPSDLVQETFIAADQHFGEFNGGSEGELIIWLRRVLSTQVADLYRRHTAQKRDFRLDRRLLREIDNSSCLLSQALPVDRTTPSQVVARREEAVLLANALDRLSEDSREVIVLRSFEELPFIEVAERMGRTVDSVKNLWARALVKLRDQLGEEI